MSEIEEVDERQVVVCVRCGMSRILLKHRRTHKSVCCSRGRHLMLTTR